MEKCLKKSTTQQLNTLVKFMEENPLLAKGTPVFGSSKLSTEEHWKTITKKLNSIGPPTRSMAEWKKSWADLKSRTKKKISENKKSIRETGGGMYRFNNLTEIEQIVDRTLSLSSAGAPSGNVFGGEPTSSSAATHIKKVFGNPACSRFDSIDDCFQSLVETPPRNSKAVAVITPSPKTDKEKKSNTPATTQYRLSQNLDQIGLDPKSASKRQNVDCNDSDFEFATSSSAKKKKSKTIADKQLHLLRRQVVVAEGTVAVMREQAQHMKKLGDAAEALAEMAKKKNRGP